MPKEDSRQLATFLNKFHSIEMEAMRRQAVKRGQRFGQVNGWEVDILAPDPEINPNLKIIKAIPLSPTVKSDRLIDAVEEGKVLEEALLREMLDLHESEWFLNIVVSGAGKDRVKNFLNDPARKAAYEAGHKFIVIQTGNSDHDTGIYRVRSIQPRVSADEQAASQTA